MRVIEMNNTVGNGQKMRGDGGDFLRWPRLRINQLTKGQTYYMRPVPSHPTRNPNGLQAILGYKLTIDGKATRFISPRTLNPEAPCAFASLVAAVDNKFVEDPGFHAWITSLNAKEPVTEDDRWYAEYKECVLKGWDSFVLPVVLYASCKEKKVGQYTNYVDYTPDFNSVLYRVLELNVNKSTAAIREFFNEVDFANLDKKVKPRPQQWNHRTEGQSIMVKATGEGAQSTISFIPNGQEDLPDELLAKLDESDFNYPDILKWQVESGIKPFSEVMNAIRASSIGPKLIEKGVLLENN